MTVTDTTSTETATYPFTADIVVCLGCLMGDLSELLLVQVPNDASSRLWSLKRASWWTAHGFTHEDYPVTYAILGLISTSCGLIDCLMPFCWTWRA